MTPGVLRAVTPPVTPDPGLIPAPIWGTVLALLFLAGLLADVRGKWNGPVTRVKERRAAAAGPVEVPPEVAAIRVQMDGMVADLRRLQAALNHQTGRLDDAQQREEIRDRLAAEHRRWDVAVVNKLIDLGVHDMPDPPPLHVHPSYMPRERR